MLQIITGRFFKSEDRYHNDCHGESFLCMRSNYISIEENSVIFQIV